MFTTEVSNNSEYITTTVCDDEMIYENVTIVYGDNLVIIRQYNESTEAYEMIQLSPKMYVELIGSFSKPKGTYGLQLV